MVVQELRKLLSGSGPDPGLGLDADLRPEGKAGPLVRSVDSFRTYYERWALTWEFQALLRATPIAGPPSLADAFLALIDPLRWPEGGITASQVRDIRTLKARVESERLPRGADPRTHLKLGRGGLTDVEWVVQLHQLEHAHAHPALRVTGTMAGLAALELGGTRRDRGRQGAAGGLAPRGAHAQRRRPVAGETHRQRPVRPARPRRDRSDHGPVSRRGSGARRAVAPGRATLAPRH